VKTKYLVQFLASQNYIDWYHCKPIQVVDNGEFTIKCEAIRCLNKYRKMHPCFKYQITQITEKILPL